MIIDFHTHVFPDKIADRTISFLAQKANISPFANGTVSGLLNEMQRGSVDISIALPVLTSPKQFDSILSFTESINSGEFKDKIVSFMGMHPDLEDKEEKIKLIKEKGFKGIKIHPDYQSTFIDDERYVRILECAKALDLITVTHAGVDGAYIGQPVKCTPDRVLSLLDKIGGYPKLVLAHIGGDRMFDEVYSKLAGTDVYFDTAYSLHSVSENEFKKILEKHGDEKILFATDSPWRNIGEEVEIIKSYKLGKDTEKKIFSENARLLLGI